MSMSQTSDRPGADAPRLSVTRTDGPFGAIVRGVDLRSPLEPEIAGRLRVALVTQGVLAFPDQKLDDDDLERVSLSFGPFGIDPYIRPIPGRKHIAAIRRRADEKAPLFAENWHSDWSFLDVPPAFTCLYGIDIPPHGGDTWFANQQMAWDRMPADLRERMEGVVAVHSARGGYAPKGQYGERDVGRSMDIVSSDDALATQRHLLVRDHPETGRRGIFSTHGYIIALENCENGEALLREVVKWQTPEEVVYRHKWAPNMLVVWDNRVVLHRATGGYDGYDRLLHRTTVADRRTQ
ncbi:MAG: TauD/TfdA family dioxygenase [Hyphomicrobiales bacterium]|nr:TauD/TfdA family dioxygenase [Hyphomicrobiales bacterium]